MFKWLQHDLWPLLFGAGGMGGVWLMLAARTKSQGDVAVAHVAAGPDLVTAAAAFQLAMTKEAERITGDLRGRIEALEAQNDRLMARCEAADKAHEHCRAEVADLRAELERRAFTPPIPAYVIPAPAAPKD